MTAAAPELLCDTWTESWEYCLESQLASEIIAIRRMAKASGGGGIEEFLQGIGGLSKVLKEAESRARRDFDGSRRFLELRSDFTFSWEYTGGTETGTFTHTQSTVVLTVTHIDGVKRPGLVERPFLWDGRGLIGLAGDSPPGMERLVRKE